tara:strand:- start:2197 stop:2379 length:183 start_codon:yes stop_codon:yes gene_type:complete
MKKDKSKVYSVVFQYTMHIEADSKEEAERLAYEDYRLQQPDVYQLGISIDEIEGYHFLKE